MTNLFKGKFGEDLACEFLKKQGYKIIERNYRIRGGEIDIIALDEKTLVYVEVKTRTSHQFGLPEESITYYKMKFLQRAVKFYRANRKNLNLPDAERIDFVGIDVANGESKVNLIKNAIPRDY